MNTTMNKYWDKSEEGSALSGTPGEDAIEAVTLGELLHRSAERTPTTARSYLWRGDNLL